MLASDPFRRPVHREDAQRYLLVMLVFFAATVVGTRWYLQLTGFPKIGGGDLHIAHALWGGVLLYAASLMPLVMRGRSVYLVAAAASGTGMGLFIDEVGKFITERNDYFYPAAAPLIYATFLVSVLVYLHVRRRRATDARNRLLNVLDRMEEAVEADLQPAERRLAMRDLERVVEETEGGERARLAEALHGYLGTAPTSASPKRRYVWHAIRKGWLRRRRRWIGQRGARLLLIVALLLAGLNALVVLALTSVALITGLPPAGVPLFIWRLLHLLAEALAGALLLSGALLIAAGRARTGTRLTSAGLVVALVFADLLSFYLLQFDSVFTVLFHIALLVAVSTLGLGRGNTTRPHVALAGSGR